MKNQLLLLLAGLVCLTGITPTASADTASATTRVSDLSHRRRVWVPGHYSHHGGYRHWVPGHWRYYY